MDAVKFLEERKRMFKEGSLMPCLDGDIGYNSKEAVKIVEEWSAAHPRKTRQSKFLEQYPDAETRSNGVLDIKPCSIEKSMVCCMCCPDCYEDFWLQEVK